MTKIIKHRINALEIENAELRRTEALSMRDQFAMAALTGLASAVGTPPSIAAIEAYAFADAMLIERVRREQEEALATEYYENMLQTIEDTLQEVVNVKPMVD
jgi:hypothetical protein